MPSPSLTQVLMTKLLLKAGMIMRTWKMKFKQNDINAYFCSKTTIYFELEMRRLEREKLLEMKRRKELAWTERRRELKDEQEQRRMRLERAAISTLTARTGHWSVREEGGVQSPKRRRDSDWLTTPSKRSRGGRGRGKKNQELHHQWLHSLFHHLHNCLLQDHQQATIFTAAGNRDNNSPTACYRTTIKEYVLSTINNAAEHRVITTPGS